METLGCDQLITELMQRGDFLPLVAIVMGCLTGMTAIVCGAIAGSIKARAREQTRRELAAYVAEGSIGPEQAASLMDAGIPKWESGSRT